MSRSAARPWILLVEDNPADVTLVREALEEHSLECELVVVPDGESAIEFVKEVDAEASCPDLVVLDLNLPRKSGREVLAALRESIRCSHVPVVVLTSSDDQQDREDAARLGASRYIRKPLRLAEFIALGAIFKEMLGENRPL